VLPTLDAARFGAVVAAVHLTVGFDAVADDVAIAVVAFGRQRVDRALETVKRVTYTIGDDLERFLVVVAADFAACHGRSPQKGVSMNRQNATF
jgi:hypothetical protein